MKVTEIPNKPQSLADRVIKRMFPDDQQSIQTLVIHPADLRAAIEAETASEPQGFQPFTLALTFESVEEAQLYGKAIEESYLHRDIIVQLQKALLGQHVAPLR